MTQAIDRNAEGHAPQPTATVAEKAAPRTPEGRMIGSEFVRTKGAECPRCGSTNITAASNLPTITPVLVEIRCNCGDCKATWLKLYGLAGYDRFVDGSNIAASHLVTP